MMRLSPQDIEAVYRHVSGRVQQGLPASCDNRSPHGPRDIAAALRRPEDVVKVVLQYLVLQGNLGRERNRLSIGATAFKAGSARPTEQLFVGGLPSALAERIGLLETNPTPRTPIDWAIHWAQKQVNVFPVERFLGTPLISRWYSSASYSLPKVTEWWAEFPTADIAAVPDRSGLFVLIATAEQDGLLSLAALEQEHGPLPAIFRHENRWGDIHIWLEGHAATSHHSLGRGLHVIGRGQFVFMPDSWAPDVHYAEEGVANA